MFWDTGDRLLHVLTHPFCFPLFLIFYTTNISQSNSHLMFFILALEKVFLITWIVWYISLYKSYKWVKKEPVYYPHFTFYFLNDTLKRKPNIWEHFMLLEEEKRNTAYYYPMKVSFLWNSLFYDSIEPSHLGGITICSKYLIRLCLLVTLKLWRMLAPGTAKEY